MEGVRNELEIVADSQGLIQFRLKDAFLESYMNDIIKKDRFFLKDLECVRVNLPKDPKINIAIIYPMFHMCNPITPDDFRRWWFCEATSRIYGMLH